MTNQGISNQDIEDGVEANGDTHSRRALLASIGAGAAGLALSGLSGTASASGEESSAGEFIDSTSAATTATSDGSWSDSAVWDNGVPTAEQTVRIDSGVTVTVDTTTAEIKNLDVAGTLQFARDTDSHLRAETIVTRPDSTMDIGTESDPIQQGNEAHVTIVHHEDISEKDDPNRISKGILAMGELAIHGAEKTSWDELASAPTAGDTSIELASAPTNWTEGDEIVIPGLDPNSNEDDERTIASVSGATVELDEPLEYDHVPPENNLDVELTAYTLNCTRNVRFESEVKETDVTNEARINRQGHLMIMKPAQSISYLEVDHFGRTNKNYWMDDLIYAGDGIHGHGTDEPSEPNVTARYGLHFHKTGIGEDPHEVTGAVVKHSPGWGVVNHSSHANVRDSITYDVFGAGFVAESGKERGSFERCFALRSEGSRNTSDIYHNFSVNGESPPQNVDFGHEGEGFWLQGPAVAVDDCVAAGHDSYAFALWNEALDGNIPDDLANEDGLYEGSVDGTVCTRSGRRQTCKFVEPGTLDPHLLPLKSFSNNTVFASAGGFDYAFCRPDRPSVVDTFTVYNIAPRVDNQYPAGVVYEYGRRGNCMIAERYSSKLKVENPQFCNVDGVDGGHGIRRNYSAEHPPGVYGGVMEGLNVGVQVCIDAAGEDIHDVRFFNNNTDIVFEVPSVPLGGVAGGVDSVADLDIHPETSVKFEFDASVTAQPETAEWEGGSGTHTFSVPGGYGFRWPDEDTPGSITVSGEVPEEQGPNAAFDYQSTAAMGEAITFDASPTLPSDSISSYEWEFGSGTTATGKTVEHTYDAAGEYDVTLTVTDSNGDTDTRTETVSVSTPDNEGQSAYGRDSPWPVPGRIQAEDFDSGGPGVAYSDADEQNRQDSEYRDTGVDMQQRDDGGHNIGLMAEGEWLEYTIEVEEAASYDITANLASGNGDMDGALAYKLDGSSLASLTVTGTGGWDNYTTMTVEAVELSAGEHVLGVHVADTDGNPHACDLDWIELTRSEGSSGEQQDDQSISEAIDEDDDGEIDDDEILDALDHWTDGEPVPGTGGQTISDQQILDLVESWQETGSE